jgi:aryl-alcohol dehydrogenase-like predicted oxidoreductase
MRTIPVSRLNREVPVLGFGCASLGSRISAVDGDRAIAHAIDLGLSWFDVAPPYGDGHAETVLGRALRGNRAKVIICTKFGIAPPQVPLAARLVRPLARKVVSAFPQLRAAAARSRPVGRRLPIDPKAIEASVVRSLRQLCTDYIDVLAVHEPSLDEAANSEIFDVLRRLIERGLVRAISVAGTVESLETVARNRQPIEIAQFPDTPFSNAAADLRAAFPTPRPMFVTHGVFGSSVAQRLAQASVAQRARLNAVAERHGFELTTWPYDLLLRFAFSNNPDGVVILSMFDPKHIEANAAAARLPPAPDLAGEIRAALAEPAPSGK